LQELGAIMQALSWQNLRHFVAAVSSRRCERHLDRPTQGEIDNECLIRMGALAAGAVHELRSPLTTMAVLVDELRRQAGADERRELAENLRIMSEQIEACRHILSVLAMHGGDALVDDPRISGSENAVSRKKLRLLGERA
jgi:signal transduction histidine kinase